MAMMTSLSGDRLTDGEIAYARAVRDEHAIARAGAEPIEAGQHPAPLVAEDLLDQFRPRLRAVDDDGPDLHRAADPRGRDPRRDLGRLVQVVGLD